ncbi:MAG: hypothetical protein HZA61_07605 [Candidatus Eisenbacteria bacterium]|uniref:BPL/LPL catalytic domain-containing protein n=1 Tax=Eiseniibacteriota bacterium TaxID=2212470 RepID=A0A933SCT1_UNCEI|nr:hypothetical protein [Candidatus Eisenbacteria bacterium]
MILWRDGAHDARENMARDARLLAACEAGALEGPVLRLFRFAPAGITLGSSQSPEAELDLARLDAAGIVWAVRPTGGRAIWHDEEWTFSLTARLGPDGWAPDATAAYAKTCGMLAVALRRLGVPVELSPGSPRGVGRPRGGAESAPPCFASTARHELTLRGRKFAGIAQRRRGAALLPQGSLLLGDSHLRLADWARLDEGRRAEVRVALAAATAHAGEWLGPDAPLERLEEAIAADQPLERRLGPGDAAAWFATVPAAAVRRGDA